MTLVSLIADGDRVASEVESSGDLRNGRRYHQHNHFLLDFRDGKIASVHEYLDTTRVRRMDARLYCGASEAGASRTIDVVFTHSSCVRSRRRP